MIRFIDIESKHNEYIKKAKILYTFRSVENLWSDLAELFQKEKVRYIPVITENEEILCLAYIKYCKMEKSIISLEKDICSSGSNFLYFLKEFFKYTQVQIYGFNECAWQLYQLLKKYKICVRVYGSRWNQFFVNTVLNSCEETDNKIKRIWTIHTESDNEQNPPDNIFLTYFEIIYDAYVIRNWKKYFKNKEILFQCIPIPQMDDLKRVTVDEQFRSHHSIAPSMPKEKWEDDKVRKHMSLDRKNWGYSSWNEWKEIEEKKIETEIELDDVRYYCCKHGNGSRRIYVIGPCIVRGVFVRDKESLGYRIYCELKKSLVDLEVICLSPSRGSLITSENLIEKLLLRKGDVIIYFGGNVPKSIEQMGIYYEKDVDLQSIFDERNVDYFWDVPIHTNAIANLQIAKFCVKEIMENHADYFKINDQNRVLIQRGRAMLPPNAEDELVLYINKVRNVCRVPNDKRKGAIVVNCNPMTIGHLYLIKKAKQMVDFLYIFVVEEDRSEFSFPDRIEMVKRAVMDMADVAVFPSGKFIISYMTMPIYFEKEKRQEEVWDASSDLQIFCEKIAPALGITIRFMGEEVKDKITMRYNKTLSELAPLYGIEFKEIPRFELDGKIVSASEVRRYLKAGKIELAQTMVPEVNWKIISEYNKKP